MFRVERENPRTPRDTEIINAGLAKVAGMKATVKLYSVINFFIIVLYCPAVNVHKSRLAERLHPPGI